MWTSFFTDPQTDAGEWDETHQWSKGRGRLEERRLRITTLLNPLFAREWAGIGQAFALRRRATHCWKCTQQMVYGITCLPLMLADPARLLEVLQPIGISRIAPIIGGW